MANPLSAGAAACLLLLLLVPADRVRGHGSMLMPAPRNAVDSETKAWSHGQHPPTGSIQPYSCTCSNGTSTCNSGQACFWFQQGCTIGCAVR